MSKKQFFKVTGFISTLAAGTALVATAATGTGAWFTDSQAGSISANTGALSINLTGSERNLNFANMMPGDYQKKTIGYQVHQSSGLSDVWLTFNKDNAAVGAFTGAKEAPYPDGGLGRYGHFRVLDGNGNQIFVSNNLTHAPKGVTGQSCSVDAITGHGGSNAKPSGEDDTIPYCGVPYSIKLASGLSDGNMSNFTIEFGYTGKMKDQGQVLATVPFDVVATQAGHGPNDKNF